ncbi:MAG: HD domain-containing phosphohydrolase [Acidobacteriota bacterium]
MIHALIVEDEEPIARLLKQILERTGCQCTCASSAAEARQHLKKGNYELVLSDIVMPGESGLDLMRFVLSAYPETAAVMVTGQDDPQVAELAIEIGVYDYIVKPFGRNEVLISVANALRRRRLEIDSRKHRERLEQIITQRTAELQNSMQKFFKSLEGAIQAIALTVEMRDPYTAGHQARVADLACAIAEEMGMPAEQAAVIHMAGTLHDIGKISIPAEILVKPIALTDNEFGLIQAHPRVGHDILRNIDFPWPIAQIVLQHHERLDGSGYPEGLRGEAILLEARILGVADVVEAMSSHRPYRPAHNIQKALDEIQKNSSILYDPRVVASCLKVVKKEKAA